MAQQKQPFWHNLVAGGVAGVTEILVMYPLDVVKTRAQLHVGSGTSMFTVLMQMVKNEGKAGNVSWYSPSYPCGSTKKGSEVRSK